MKKIYCRIMFDSTLIKESNIWKIVLIDEDNKVLYVETKSGPERYANNPSFSENNYNDMMNKLYFHDIIDGADTKIKISFYSDMDHAKIDDINVFINSDSEIRKKIKDYIKNISNGEDVVFVFKNSFENILFFNYMGDMTDFNIGYFNEDVFIFDANNVQYERWIKISIDSLLEENSNIEEFKTFCTSLDIVIETLLLKDCVTNLLK